MSARIVSAGCVASAIAAASALARASLRETLVSAAAAGALWLIAQAIDQAPESLRAAGCGLAPAVDVRALAAVVFVLSAAHELGAFPLGILFIALAMVVAGIGIYVVHTLWPPPIRVLIVGSGEVARHVVRILTLERRATVVGYVNDEPLDHSTDDDAPVVGELRELPALIKMHKAEAVIFAFSAQSERKLVLAMRRCRALGVAVSVVPRMFQELDQRATVRRIAGLPLITIDPGWRDRRLPMLSRVFDVLVASLLIVVSAPLLVLVALAIVIDSPGPLFYRAERVGQGGRPFSMLKFRKMSRDATGPRITLANDQRFTRIGSFLHASKLDELPQLWNVIRGEMTLVGPRPEDPEYVSLYPDGYSEILKLRPGMTGLAALKYRNETHLMSGSEYEERYRNELLPDKISIERDYAARRTFGLDLRILVWTGVALLRGVRVERCPVTDHLSFRRSTGRV